MFGNGTSNIQCSNGGGFLKFDASLITNTTTTTTSNK